MSWFKKEVDAWDIVGRTIAPLPPSVDWEDEEVEEVELAFDPQTDANGLVAALGVSDLDPNAELLKKLKKEAEQILKREER